MEAAALGVGNMQYGDWCDKQAGRRHARQHQHGRISLTARRLPLGILQGS
ncbi:hypothetical protein FOXYSP1_17336 [Fusarium oxysporum f. sp. phaseoli]